MAKSRNNRWSMLVAVAIGCFFMAESATAGVITFFTDRTTWVTAATDAGLLVTIDDFSSEPTAYPDLTIGGIDFTVSI